MQYLTQDLNLTLVQCSLAWEAPADNRAQLAELLHTQRAPTDVIVLPEMFTTGFSMNALANAEPPGGETEAWLQNLAREFDCAITGSLAVRVDGQVFNRMLFATPSGVHHYDKRHLFRMADEHLRYGVGDSRVVVHWRGWHILLQVCYDLRFPVFSRNRNDYDLALYVANWPSPRRLHWRSLLQARAIENLACCAGVNRIGSDARGLHYSGDSLCFDAEGRCLLDARDEAGCHAVRLSAASLTAWREQFPAHLDADGFALL